MIVTCWYRDRGDGLKYNHFSQGFDPDAEYPPYMFDSQRVAWGDGVWVMREGRIEAGVVSERQPPSSSTPPVPAP